jgi:hypothetical protein
MAGTVVRKILPPVVADTSKLPLMLNVVVAFDAAKLGAPAEAVRLRQFAIYEATLGNVTVYVEELVKNTLSDAPGTDAPVGVSVGLADHLAVSDQSLAPPTT